MRVRDLALPCRTGSALRGRRALIDRQIFGRAHQDRPTRRDVAGATGAFRRPACCAWPDGADEAVRDLVRLARMPCASSATAVIV